MPGLSFQKKKTTSLQDGPQRKPFVTQVETFAVVSKSLNEQSSFTDWHM